MALSKCQEQAIRANSRHEKRRRARDTLRACGTSDNAERSIFGWISGELQNGHVTRFLRNRRFAERAPTPSRAFVPGFLKETSNSSEFPSQTLCGTRDDAEHSVSCGILEETVVSSNSAESVTVFWRNNSEFAERTSLWNEQRRPAECFPSDFLRKRTKLGNTQTTVPTERLGRLGQPCGTHRHYGSGNPPHLANTG